MTHTSSTLSWYLHLIVPSVMSCSLNLVYSVLFLFAEFNLAVALHPRYWKTACAVTDMVCELCFLLLFLLGSSHSCWTGSSIVVSSSLISQHFFNVRYRPSSPFDSKYMILFLGDKGGYLHKKNPSSLDSVEGSCNRCWEYAMWPVKTCNWDLSEGKPY